MQVTEIMLKAGFNPRETYFYEQRSSFDLSSLVQILHAIYNQAYILD